MNAQKAAQDAYATLCSLYGDHNAQTLMRIRGACQPRIAVLARRLGRSRAAVKACVEYRTLVSLRPGYMRLMTAAHGDGSVKRLIATLGRFTPWEIDTAVAIVAAVS